MVVELYKTAVTFFTDNETQVYISINLLLDDSCDSSPVFSYSLTQMTPKTVIDSYEPLC